MSSLRNENPRSSKIDCIQGLGLCSPTVAAEEELVKRHGCSGSSRSINPTNSPSNRSPRRRSSSSKKDQSYDPSTGIHTSRSSNPEALRRLEKNATDKTRGRKP